jgi:hypothetical protein
MTDWTAKVKTIGLTQVYCTKEKPLVDIVFVHGLNGHPYNTWSTKEPPVFWPADLLPSLLEPCKVRILTYGYNANVTAFTDGASKDHIHQHAETLASTLAANRNVSYVYPLYRDLAKMLISSFATVRIGPSSLFAIHWAVSSSNGP